MGIKFVVLGDIHFPFHSKKAISYSFDIIKKLKPDYVVQIGDIYDFYALSRFPRSLNIYTPEEELKLARDCAIELWGYIQKISPESKCYQLLGNHDLRIKARLLEKLPEALGLVKINELFEFQDVKTIFDATKEVIIEDIVFMHGYYTKPGDHCLHNRKNTVLGHLHRGYTFFTQVENKPLWELNAGHLSDYPSEASYLKQRWTKWTKGIGVIDDMGPRFIPFLIPQKRIRL